MQLFRHRIGDHEPRALPEPAARELVLYRLQQVRGLVLLDHEVRVARQLEDVGGEDLLPREELVQVRGYNLLDLDELYLLVYPRCRRLIGALRRRNPHEALYAGRHLYPRHHIPVPVLDYDQEVQREVGDVREGVRGVYCERGENRQDVPGEELPELLLLPLEEVTVGGELNTLFFQRGQELVLQYLPLFGEEPLGVVVDAVQLLLGGHPIRHGIRQLGGDLMLEPGDPDHKKLVEVGLRDGDEPHPLQQGMPLVLRLRQHALVKAEPAELAVYVQRRVREVYLFLGRGHPGSLPSFFLPLRGSSGSPLNDSSAIVKMAPSLIPPRATTSSGLSYRSSMAASVVIAAGITRARSGASPPSRVRTPDIFSEISAASPLSRSRVSRSLVSLKMARAEPPMATTAAFSGRSQSGSLFSTASLRASSSPASGGSLRTWLSVVRLVPKGNETCLSEPFTASPRMSWAEPPPRSTTNAGPSHGKFGRVETAPRKPRRASSLPEIMRISRPTFSRTPSHSVGPFSASRTALVASTAVSETSYRAASLAKSPIASTATRIRASSILPVLFTPEPRRAEIFSPATGRTAPFSTSPTSRWMVFEPTSMTALRARAVALIPLPADSKYSGV